MEACQKEWQRPTKWKSMILSKALKQSILSACGALKLWLEDSDHHAAEPLEEVQSKKPQMLLDSHMLFGWELLRWHFSPPHVDFFVQRGFLMLDPVLSGTWLLDVQSDFVADKATLEREMLKIKDEAKVLFCPLHGEGHWSLLVLMQPVAAGDKAAVHYFDSMASDTEKAQINALKAQQLLKHLLQDDNAVLPEKEVTQMQESDDCGFWVLAFILEILALFRNEGPRSRGQTKIQVANLKGFLASWTSILKAEQNKSMKDLEKKQAKLNEELESLKKKAVAMAKSVKDTALAASEAEKLADAVYNKNKVPDLSDLPESAKQAILKISEMGNPGVCSRCRWTSGCLSCSVEKAEKYHLNVLRHSLGLAKLCQGLIFC